MSCICGEATGSAGQTPFQKVGEISDGLKGVIYAGEPTPIVGSLPGPTLGSVVGATSGNIIDVNTLVRNGVLATTMIFPNITSAFVAPDSTSFNFGTDVNFMLTSISRTTATGGLSWIAKREAAGDTAGYSLDWSSANRATGALKQGAAGLIGTAGLTALNDGRWRLTTLLVNHTTGFVYLKDDLSTASQSAIGTFVMALPSGSAASTAIFSLGRNSQVAGAGSELAFASIYEGAQLDAWDSRRLHDWHHDLRLISISETADNLVFP